MYRFWEIVAYAEVNRGSILQVPQGPRLGRRHDRRPHHYLGPFGSAESKTKFAEKIAEWQRNRSVAPVAVPSVVPVYTVGQLALEYLRFAKGYYVKNGKTTKQAERVQTAFKTLVKLYEELLACGLPQHSGLFRASSRHCGMD